MSDQDQVHNIPYSPQDGQASSMSSSGPFLATVVSHLDNTYMGRLQVEIKRTSSGDKSSGQIHPVSYMSPFYGVTGANHLTDTDDYNNTQKSYGMWMVPPDPGTTVVVFFIDGDPKRGYWMGCVADTNMNFMVPGLAAQTKVVGQSDGLKRPTAEYNKKVTASTGDPEQIPKAAHPFTDVLETQGLLADDIRGITTSSARRETPSMVFGISTPGPLDKRSGSKTGKIGKAEWEIPDAPVSRLGGTTFVMDDGDDNYLRKTKASAGPPDYAAVSQQDQGGNPTIPHNELFRIRTRTGHQILLHNSEDLIYIGNASGTTWIELTSNGKIDVYAKDSISFHTDADFNFHAGRDVNIEAGRNFNVKAAGKAHVESGANLEIIVGANGFITTTGNLNLKTTGNHLETAAKIYMNSSTAATAAVKLSTHVNQTDVGNITSIMKRIPSHEPYPHHENLDPTKFVPAQTDRDVGGNIAQPTYYSKKAAPKYTQKPDTFLKIGPAGG
jgi:hypothetical protein